MAKAPTKQLTSDTRRATKGVSAFEQALTRWMLRKARREAREEIERQLGKVSKADPPFDQELFDLLKRYGLAHGVDAAMSAAATTEGLERLIDPQEMRVQLRRLAKLSADGKAPSGFRLKWFEEIDDWYTRRVEQITADTQNMVKESVARIIDEALTEVPQPSPGEIARRIRTQYHGTDPQGRMFAFSPERAALIAKNELAQISQVAKEDGYRVVNRIAEKNGRKTQKRWLAYRDGRSGDRHHEKLHNVTIDVDDYFVTPLRNRLRYPHDPSGAKEDTIGCRCSHRLIIL